MLHARGVSMVAMVMVLGVGGARGDGAKPAATCDAAALKTKAMQYYGKSQYGAALSAFGDAYACKADAKIATLAALSACKSVRATEARDWYAKSEPATQANIVQTCAAATPPIVVASTCDFDALRATAKTYYAKNQYGAALSGFQDAYACQADDQVAALAALAACKAGRVKEAKHFYALAATAFRSNIQQVCAQTNVQLD